MSGQRGPLVLTIGLGLGLGLVACGGVNEPSADPLVEVVARLRGAGAAVEVAGPVEQPFLEPAGTILRVDGEDVQAFVFPSEGAAVAQAAEISGDGTQVGTTLILWVAPPHFYRFERVILLYVGTSDVVPTRLSRAFGAPFAGG